MSIEEVKLRKYGPTPTKEQDQGSAPKLITPINATQSEYIKNTTHSSISDKKTLSLSERLDNSENEVREIRSIIAEVKDLISLLDKLVSSKGGKL